MSDIPAGRCVVCRSAWEPCRSCKGKALRAKQDATMARNGTKRALSPENFKSFSLARDPGLHKHEVAHSQKEDQDV